MTHYACSHVAGTKRSHDENRAKFQGIDPPPRYHRYTRVPFFVNDDEYMTLKQPTNTPVARLHENNCALLFNELSSPRVIVSLSFGNDKAEGEALFDHTLEITVEIEYTSLPRKVQYRANDFNSWISSINF